MVGVVDEPVDEGGGDHGVAEDLAPLLEAAIGGDRSSRARSGAHEGEEQVGCLALQWQVADLVDHDEVVALQAAQLVFEPIVVLGVLEPADPFLGGGERDPIAVVAGVDA